MRRLEHGYTNRTFGDGAVVEKHYEGPYAEVRRERERRALSRVRGRVPVPPVLGADGGVLKLGFVQGKPGQELLESGAADAVLRSCGEVLKRIHALPHEVAGSESFPRRAVVVHGDFGPNNLLLDPDSFEVTAVLDWEFVRLGDPIEDLAWCEWIVRTHHPDLTRSLPRFFGAYGRSVPAWKSRKAAMLGRCRELKAFCERWEPDGDGVRLWEGRIDAVESWTELAHGGPCHAREDRRPKPDSDTGMVLRRMQTHDLPGERTPPA